MTGKDLILYILQNDLEDEPLYENGNLLGFMNSDEAALKFKVGSATIEIWCQMGILPNVLIGDRYYIPVNAVKKDDAK